MITKDNLQPLLLSLNFEKSRHQYSKHFINAVTYLKVDFDKNLLIYPEDQGLKIHERQTCNFNEDGLAVSKLFQPPVVLVTIAANIGDTAVLDYPACFTDSVVGLTPKAGINARFLELMMRTHKQHLNDTAPQMAQKNINVEILKPIKIPVPPLVDQQRLVDEIETQEANIAAAQAIIDAAASQKQAILKQYL